MGFPNVALLQSAVNVKDRSQRWQKNTGTGPPASGEFLSLWRFGEIPAGGTDPSALTARQVTNATTGAINLGSPAGGGGLYLRKVSGLVALTNAQGSLFLLDRLLDYGGIDHNTALLQTLTNGVGLARYTTGDGVLAFLEVTTTWNFGPGGITITINYTNELGVAGRTSTTTLSDDTVAGSIPHRPMWLNVQAGDKGIRSVQSVQCNGTLIVGTSNLVLAKPVLVVSLMMAGTLIERELVMQNTILPKLESGHALQWAATFNITSFLSRTYFGEFFAVEG